ncbi:chaperonin 10-like protein [Aspergillus carlsbadensis]|nr:chaperonin 10-like protein [Aspergillus carlsbadensis]
MTTHATQAIVCHPPANGERQWHLEDIQVGEPADDEVLVEVASSGVCHTDLGCGTNPDGTPGFPVPPYPRVLGHEGAGYVRGIGSKITKVKLGDAVLLSFAFCTHCHNCQFGAPGYCESFSKINFTGHRNAFTYKDQPGQAIGGSFFGQSSFSRLTRVQETSLVNVSDWVQSRDELQVLAPLGCGIQTGAGTVTELAGATARDKIAVIGLGGVGLAAIMAAKLRGCQTIIGIDRVAARIELAKSLGATHGVDTSSVTDLPAAVRKITGSGTTITIDATGVVPLIHQGLEFTANQGKMILVGVAPMDSSLNLAVVPHMVSGKQLLGSMEGGVLPEKYIPQLLQWYRDGKYPFDRLVKFYPVLEYKTAIEDMESGTTIKPVLIW